MAQVARNWELAWCPERQMYYFQDRLTGRSSWSKPSGCYLDVPKFPPNEVFLDVAVWGAWQEGTTPPPMPTGLPLDWTSVLDKKFNRYYYHRLSNPRERTWERPMLFDDDEGAVEYANNERLDKIHKSNTLRLLSKDRFRAKPARSGLRAPTTMFQNMKT
ncbi:unnamed protein product [Polarella glacialis]|uniref:WW domain-containing protein n=1 Tax=Polarella glacialis TaxID=89957 RepID=A0A813IZT4_POLGL|nr:unnamed protein product [Polarella glacialis]